MLRKMLLSSFCIFALLYIFFFDGIPTKWQMLFKLLPMLLLIVTAFITEVQTGHIYKRVLCIGLLFCALGDYTLQWFLLGLSSFLIGHIFYIAAFRTTNERPIPMPAKLLFILIGLCLALFFSTQLLAAGETVLIGAVLAYITVILTMGMTSIRVGVTIAVVGAVLFIISDTVLAFNRFITPVTFAHEIIMLTYYGAQLCFVLSIAKYDELRSKVVQ